MKLLLFAAAFLLTPLTTFAQGKPYEISKLADGVYAVIRNDSPGLAANANNVFIINEKDVVVVDTNLAPSYTRDVLSEIRKLTRKPVRYVINTHWHDDHISGNQVYREAFPDVQFIAHANMPDYMTRAGLENRRRTLARLPGFIGSLRGMLDRRKAANGRDLSEEEIVGLSNDVGLADHFISEGSTTQIILPTRTLTEKLVLQQGKRRIEILHLGRGHTSGDLIVYLPKEKIAITGDLVVHPVPYVGGDQSHVTEWSSTLDKIGALKPSIIVPGHGKILRDYSYPQLVSTLFRFVTEQTRAAISRGESLEQAQKSVSLENFRNQFCGESFYRHTMFRNYVAGPSVAAAYRELTTKN